MDTIFSDSVVLSFQKQYYKGKPANTFDPVAPSEEKVLENGVILRNEVQFSDKWPNSFADIYYGPGENLPTIVYLHGGGWFMGTRTDGDPFSSGGANVAKKNSYMAELGYNVISMDYCLAPEYRFPEQLLQINEGLRYFVEHSAELKLNMKNVIIMGGSAGAAMTDQLGLAYSDLAFAAELGIVPALPLETVSGLVIDGSPILCEGMEEGIQLMVKTWFGCNELTDAVVRGLDVSKRVTANYPASFLTAGNEGCFMRDEKVLAEALRAKSVEVEEFYVDPALGKTGHGYIDAFLTDPLAKMGMDKQKEFVTRITSRRK